MSSRHFFEQAEPGDINDFFVGFCVEVQKMLGKPDLDMKHEDLYLDNRKLFKIIIKYGSLCVRSQSLHCQDQMYFTLNRFTAQITWMPEINPNRIPDGLRNKFGSIESPTYLSVQCDESLTLTLPITNEDDDGDNNVTLELKHIFNPLAMVTGTFKYKNGFYSVAPGGSKTSQEATDALTFSFHGSVHLVEKK
ncbi:hypothetical protein HELRODRAFT_165941 [Helobdella robusta]|uniref:Uncharacterized protein n=1 Tax=Helobdella robusta TaxID=6412 RepID=T1EXH6_HELRO|nr:hypothetical protein HELRODRAFT_165941 [Helobdella robusta]ESN90294.1 hypothetical protein HELRODRAFT_165941 [Helobdella robusta]